MQPTENSPSAEALKSATDSLFENIKGSGLADPAKFWQDAATLHQAGVLEVEQAGQKQPTPILLLLQDVVQEEESKKKLAFALGPRLNAHAGTTALEADFSLAQALGLLTEDHIKTLREKYKVPEPLSVQPSVPSQDELIHLAQTGNLSDFTRVIFWVSQDKKDGQSRVGSILAEFLSRVDISLADRDAAERLYFNLFVPKEPVDARREDPVPVDSRAHIAGEPGLVPARAAERRAGSEAGTLFGRGSPFRNERRFNELWDSPTVYSAEYQAGELPVHLGQWLGEDSVVDDDGLIQNFPPAPGQWVQEPRPGPVRIMQGWVTEEGKRHYEHVDIKSLSILRAVLISGNRLFGQDDAARPPRIYGYGIANSEEYSYQRPYLVIESLDPNFMKLDQYLEDRGGRLPENEAVEITLKLCKALVKFHAFGVRHGGIFETYALKNLSWNPQTKQLRIEGWDYEKTFPRHFDGVAVAGEIHSMGALLFRLTTGKSWSQTDQDIGESVGEKYPTDSKARGRDREQQIMSLMTALDPDTRKVLQRSLDIGEEMEYSEGYLVANSKRMLIDLFRAYQVLAGRILDTQAAGYLAEAEKRLIYRNVARAYKEHQSSLYNLPQAFIKYPNHPVPPDRIKEVAEDIEKRKKSEPPMTIDQIIDMMAQSYNFNLDKTIELAGIDQI